MTRVWADLLEADLWPAWLFAVQLPDLVEQFVASSRSRRHKWQLVSSVTAADRTNGNKESTVDQSISLCFRLDIGG